MTGIPIPWTFKTWISKFESVDLPIGDLAHDIQRDSDFPEDDDFGIIYEHIIGKTSDSNVIETFVTVWNFYLATR